MGMSGELNDIEMTSGVSMFTGEPFVQIVVTIDGKPAGRGQLSPAETRAHAMAYLEVAEAADQDANFYKLMKEKLELDDKVIGHLLSDLRAMRDDK